MVNIINNKYVNINDLSSDDYYQCINLLTQLLPSCNYEDLCEKLKLFFECDPALKCLVLKDNNECIGVQCIVDRKLKYFGTTCRVAGLSYMAIKPEYQNAYAANIIKKYMFKYIDDNADLSLGFARKVMDNYWYPYGFRGITNFCEISLPIKCILSTRNKVNSRKVKAGDISVLSKFYNDTHVDLIGPLQRPKKLWEYYLKKCKKMSMKLFVMDIDKKPIGYYIINDNVVLETGYDLNYAKQIFMHFVFKLKNLGYNKVIFKIGKKHPLINTLTRYEHSINTRYVWRGGHIVRITSVCNFLIKIIAVLESRVIKSNLYDFDFLCNSIRFAYSNKKLSISINNQNKSNITFDRYEWVKLIFGACMPTHIIGFEGDVNENILRILFPVTSPQFLEIDQL